MVEGTSRTEKTYDNGQDDEKQEFRLNWAKEQFDQEVRSSKKSWQEYKYVKEEHGVYEPLARLIELQGYNVDK